MKKKRGRLAVGTYFYTKEMPFTCPLQTVSRVENIADKTSLGGRSLPWYNMTNGILGRQIEAELQQALKGLDQFCFRKAWRSSSKSIDLSLHPCL